MRLQQPNRELAVRNELADLLTKLGDLEKSLPPSDRDTHGISSTPGPPQKTDGKGCASA